MPQRPKRDDRESEGEEDARPPAKRLRTDEQLHRKRQKDRLKHKANRAESKTQLSNIENDVSEVRAHLELLLSKIESLRSVAPAESSPSQGPSSGEYRRENGSPWADTQSSNAGERTGANSPIKVAPLVGTGMPQLPNVSTASVCRCGIDHPITDCPSYSGVAMLYQAHSAMASDPNFVTSLPRSPTIANYMLMDDGNPVCKLVGLNTRQFPMKNVETLWAFMFLIYRLFRWRLCPTAEFAADMPSFMRPTETQQAVVHSLNIDYIPWPKLRDYLCHHLNHENIHTVKLYMESFAFVWPKEKPLMVRDEAGSIVIHPDFEERASSLANWRLGSPWTEACPEMVHLVLN